MRQRFKTEINRLTRGDMLDMLKHKSPTPDEAENLSFIMTYVYAWNWLQQNLHTKYQPEVLNAFAKGPQAFLMKMMLQSQTTTEFIQTYINYWMDYQGEAQLQQQQLLQLLQEHNTPTSLAEYIETSWNSLHLFSKTFSIGYKDLAKQEKDRYADMLSEDDKERLNL